MAPTLPPEIFDQICAELHAELWVDYNGRLQYQPVDAFDVRGRRPRGRWPVARRTLKCLRLSSKTLNIAASRVFFRRLTVPIWPESRTPVLNLERLSNSPYAVHVEELMFIQWPNAEQGDHDVPILDPDLRAFSGENRQALRRCCAKFSRLRELGMDDTGFYSSESPMLQVYDSFWRGILEACPPSLMRLYYTSPARDAFGLEEESSVLGSWGESEPDNRWDETQLKVLHLTFGQYFTQQLFRPRFPACIGVQGLEELHINYLGMHQTFGLPAAFLALTTLRVLVLATNDIGLKLKTTGWDLRKLFLNNKEILRHLELEGIEAVEEGWDDILGVLVDSSALMYLNLENLRRKKGVARGPVVIHVGSLVKRQCWSDGAEHFFPNEVAVTQALLERTRQNLKQTASD